MNGMVAEAAYSKSGWITETENCLLAVGVNCLYVRGKAPILRPTFLQIESTWGDQERLSSLIIPRRRVCETSLTSSFCSKKPHARWETLACSGVRGDDHGNRFGNIDRYTSERKSTRSIFQCCGNWTASKSSWRMWTVQGHVISKRW